MSKSKNVSISDLQNLNRAYRGQIIRSGVQIDVAFKRNGELVEALRGLLDGDVSREKAQAVAENNGMRERFLMVANLVDAAVDHVNGDDEALTRLTAAATSLRDYDAEKVLLANENGDSAPAGSGRGRGRGGARGNGPARRLLTEQEAVAAIQQVAKQTGEDAVSVAVFNATHPTLRAQDLIAACGKWSLVQATAGLTVTKRGRRPSAQATTA